MWGTKTAHVGCTMIAALIGLTACGGDATTVVEEMTVDTLRFTQITAGARHTCGLGGDGAAYCWGFGDDGQIGTPFRSAAWVPSAVDTPLRFVDITAGSQHTCAVATEGGVYCWGIGTWGTGVSRPRRVRGMDDVVDVSSSFGHVCGVTGDERVLCFGVASAGQLGSNADPSAGVSDSAVVVPDLDRVQRLATGLHHTCALNASGEVFCWGVDESGQLGVGGAVELCSSLSGETSVPCATTPTRVAVDGPWVDLAGGWFHTCGLRDTGEAICWGDDTFLQLGRTGAAPEECTWLFQGSGETRPCARSGVSADRLPPFASLAPGKLHTCGIGGGGEGSCWGTNTFGQLGAFEGPEGPFEWVQISGGQTHSCGIVLSGAAYCWGGGSFGQLGALTEQTTVPTLVGGSP